MISSSVKLFFSVRWREATAVGFGMNARGAMGIILAAIARDAGLLGDRMVVALGHAPRVREQADEQGASGTLPGDAS